MFDFINCTPHEITLILRDNERVTLPKCKNAPRLVQENVQVGEICRVAITETKFGKTTNLPAPIEGKFFIVSRLVLAANPTRPDLLVPNELVRDGQGVILGCKSLARN